MYYLRLYSALALALLPWAASAATHAYRLDNYDLTVNSLTCLGSPCGGGGGAGEANTASNLGGGLANFDSKLGVDLRFNSFSSADFDLGANLITIDDTKWATDAQVTAAIAALSTVYSPIYQVVVSSGSTGAGTAFVGTVYCPVPIPTSGSVPNCTATISSFGTEALTDGSFAELRGTYVIATPATTSGGFAVISTTLVATTGCIVGADCSIPFNQLTTSARAFGNLYGGINKIKPIQKYLPGHMYQGFTGDPGVYRGTEWTIDYTTRPTFISYVNMDSKTRTLAGTGSVSIAANPAYLIMSSSVCGTGTCYDGDESVKAGDVLKFGAGTWAATGPGHPGTQTKAIVMGIIDSTHIEISPPFEADMAASTVVDGYAEILEFDNVSTTTSSGTPFEGGVNKIVGEAIVDCQSFCQNMNTLLAVPRNAGTFRQVPLQLVVTRHSPIEEGFLLSDACGKDDAFFTTTFSTFNHTVSSSAGRFGHHPSGCGTWNESAWQAIGPDPNDPNDDGIGSMTRQLASSFQLDPPSTSAYYGRYLFAGGNCSVSRVDVRMAEEVAQLMWAPQGCEQITLTGSNEEQFTFCGGGNVACGVSSSRRPWIHLGKFLFNSGDTLVSGLHFNFEDVNFNGRPVPFLKVEDTHHVRVELNGQVKSTLQLLDVAANETVFRGNVLCTEGTAGACNRPSFGSFEEFVVSDLSGAYLWSGRRLDHSDPVGGYPAWPVTVQVDFGATGSFDAQTTVTGEAWVTATSRIACGPTLLPTADRLSGSDDALLDQITVTPYARSVGIGFTVKAHAPNRAFGKFIVHCVGAS